MNSIYIVEITNTEDFVFEKYNGAEEIEAKRIYDEFATRNKMKKVELYQKTILEIIERK